METVLLVVLIIMCFCAAGIIFYREQNHLFFYCLAIVILSGILSLVFVVGTPNGRAARISDAARTMVFEGRVAVEDKQNLFISVAEKTELEPIFYKISKSRIDKESDKAVSGDKIIITQFGSKVIILKKK